jgi:D-glycero-D-manno-heptose 1,7-bisphosphate phosphatase
MKRALFLDRDGTIIEDTGYVCRVEDVRLLPGVREALADLQQHYRLVLVSNQSGIGRGMFGHAELDAVHARMNQLLAEVRFAGVYYCVHRPEDGCQCRKPRPGMLQTAARDLGINLSQSIMVGDKSSDVEAGAAAGCLTAFLGLEVDREPQPRYVAASWTELSALLPR